MTKPRKATPEEALEAIRLTHGFHHPPCPRCPENPEHRPFLHRAENVDRPADDDAPPGEK